MHLVLIQFIFIIVITIFKFKEIYLAMMKKKYLIISAATFVLFTLAAFISAPSSNSENLTASTSVTEVEPQYVCMVTNKLYPKEQIPVEVSSKTYYGCCEMCKAQLENNPNKRVAVDPVSGKKVDKAESVIGASPSGNIYYFESKDNLNKFAGN